MIGHGGSDGSQIRGSNGDVASMRSTGLGVILVRKRKLWTTVGICHRSFVKINHKINRTTNETKSSMLGTLKGQNKC